MLCPDYIANDMRSGLWTTLTLNQMHVAFWKSNTLLSVAVLLQSPWGALWTQPNVEDCASSWPRARALWAMWATWAARELLKSLAKGCDDLWPCLGVIELQAFVFSSYLYTWEALQSHLAQSKRGHCSELAILCCTSAALCLMRSLVRSSKRSVFASTSNCKLYPHAYSWQATRRGIFLILGLPISPRFHATLPKLKDSIWDTISGKTRLYPKLSIQKKKHNTCIRWEARCRWSSQQGFAPCVQQKSQVCAAKRMQLQTYFPLVCWGCIVDAGTFLLSNHLKPLCSSGPHSANTLKPAQSVFLQPLCRSWRYSKGSIQICQRPCQCCIEALHIWNPAW